MTKTENLLESANQLIKEYRVALSNLSEKNRDNAQLGAENIKMNAVINELRKDLSEQKEQADVYRRDLSDQFAQNVNLSNRLVDSKQNQTNTLTLLTWSQFATVITSTCIFASIVICPEIWYVFIPNFVLIIGYYIQSRKFYKFKKWNSDFQNMDHLSEEQIKRAKGE
jgi:general stress protein CsbA